MTSYGGAGRRREGLWCWWVCLLLGCSWVCCGRTTLGGWRRRKEEASEQLCRSVGQGGDVRGVWG